MRKVNVDLGERSYDILIEPGSLKNLAKLIKPALKSNQVVVVSDVNVSRVYKKELLRYFEGTDLKATFCEISTGEKAKNFDTIKKLCEFFSESGLDRNATIIGFGGGVVGDAAGFAAAVYLRGIDFIQIPTSLLAACDSSVGGKTGINLGTVKNQVGAFHQPKLVLIDPELLRSLPEREITSGLAEVIKTGLISGKVLYDKIINSMNCFYDFSNMDIICDIIHDCVSFKAHVVENDEKESGLRRILNFGHTIGHGIEAALQKENILHGEAVILGMKCALHLSCQKRFLNKTVFEKILTDLDNIKLPNMLGHVSFEHLKEFIRKDKKNINQKISFVLLNDIGEPVQSSDITFEDMEASFNFTKNRITN